MDSVLIYMLKLKDTSLSDADRLAKACRSYYAHAARTNKGLTRGGAPLRYAPAALQELEEFCFQVDTSQHTLARKLNFVSDVRAVKVSAGQMWLKRVRVLLTFFFCPTRYCGATGVVQTPQSQLARLGNRLSLSVERMQANVARLKLDDDAAYIDILVRVFEESQFLGTRGKGTS